MPRDPSQSSGRLLGHREVAWATIPRTAGTRAGAYTAPRGAQNAGVPLLAEIAAAVAAALHVWFFALESILFARPTVWRRFGVRSAEDAAVIRPMAFNQGFYNLFLAVGVVLGLLLVAAGNPVAGRAVVVFACASMVAAGAVLAAPVRRFAGGAALRAGPPLIALLAALLR